MAKTYYEGIMFDSDLEINYYKHLKAQNLTFMYHPKVSIQITKNNVYTPDFIVEYEDRVEIIETKGYNQYSFKNDNLIHNLMENKSEWELYAYVQDNGIVVGDRKVIYKKIKFSKEFGWVDFNFKNPNTLANKRKEKIIVLESENKALIKKHRDIERYFSYLRKEKLTKDQKIWLENFEIENQLNDLYEQYWRGVKNV